MCYNEIQEIGPAGCHQPESSCHCQETRNVEMGMPHAYRHGRMGRCHQPLPEHGPGFCHHHVNFCRCHEEMSAEEKIRVFEERKQFLQQKIENIDKKLEALKSEKEA